MPVPLHIWEWFTTSFTHGGPKHPCLPACPQLASRCREKRTQTLWRSCFSTEINAFRENVHFWAEILNRIVCGGRVDERDSPFEDPSASWRGRRTPSSSLQFHPQNWKLRLHRTLICDNGVVLQIIIITSHYSSCSGPNHNSINRNLKSKWEVSNHLEIKPGPYLSNP